MNSENVGLTKQRRAVLRVIRDSNSITNCGTKSVMKFANIIRWKESERWKAMETTPRIQTDVLSPERRRSVYRTGTGGLIPLI